MQKLREPSYSLYIYTILLLIYLSWRIMPMIFSKYIQVINVDFFEKIYSSAIHSVVHALVFNYRYTLFKLILPEQYIHLLQLFLISRLNKKSALISRFYLWSFFHPKKSHLSRFCSLRRTDFLLPVWISVCLFPC